MTSAPGRAAPAIGVAPLWAVCGFTILNSFATGILNNGVYFLADKAYGFNEAQNYGLGVVLGGTYIVGALGVGPALQRLCRRLPWLTHRMVLAGIMLALAIICCVPWMASGFSDRPGAGGSWSIWLLAVAYGPLTGALWPIVESYVSGGRRAHDLREAIGTWNIVWSAAVACALWVIGPVVGPAPRLVLAGLGLVLVSAIAFLPAMGADPGRHVEDETREIPPDYERHLAVFRILLPLAYFVISAVSPNLPSALARLGVADGWRTPLAATWMVVRIPTFILLARWHGWHGRWWMAIAGATLLGVGFVLAVLGPALLADRAATAGIIVLQAGLGSLGVGMAMVYVGALYYVSAARHGAVGAGGSHEALIGAGYVGGPACGLGAALAVEGGLLAAAAFAPTVLGLVAVVLVVAGIMAWRKGRPTPAERD